MMYIQLLIEIGIVQKSGHFGDHQNDQKSS